MNENHNARTIFLYPVNFIYFMNVFFLQVQKLFHQDTFLHFTSTLLIFKMRFYDSSEISFQVIILLIMLCVSFHIFSQHSS